MLSNWAPRSEGGQRRNPGIYSATEATVPRGRNLVNAVTTKQSPFEVQMQPSFTPPVPSPRYDMEYFKAPYGGAQNPDVPVPPSGYPESPGTRRSLPNIRSGQFLCYQYTPRAQCNQYTTSSVIIDKAPGYTTPSFKDLKSGQSSDDESQTESPSTVAPDTDKEANSSDSDCPHMLQRFSSDELPDSSSDSDGPAEAASLEPATSDDNLSSGDEAPQHVRMWKTEEPPSCCENARNCSKSAKHMTKLLDRDLRDLQAEMTSLTEDLMAIKRMIPSRTCDGEQTEFFFSN